MDDFDFFSMPMGRMTPTGRDEFGRPVYRNALTDGRYAAQPRYQMGADEYLEFVGGIEDGRTSLNYADRPGVGTQARNALAGIVQGVTAPGRAARGEPVTYGDAWATALDYGALGAPMAAPDGALGIFAGRRARTADMGALERAQGMAAQGASRDDIWRDTGWFQGVDGEWRFEIDDSGAELTDRALGVSLNAGQNRNKDVLTNYEGALSHANLQDAYDMRNDVDLRHGSPAGSFYPNDGRIIARSDNPQEMRSVLLHESQHDIQGREGFAQGASPGDMAMAHMQLTRQTQDHSDALALLREVESNGGDWAQALTDYREIGAPISADGQELARRFGSVDLAQQAFDEVSKAKARLEPLREVGQWQQDAGYGPYRRVAGEVEARNVQARRNFTAEQRREIPPWATQEIPDERQITVFGNQVRLMRRE